MKFTTKRIFRIARVFAATGLICALMPSMLCSSGVAGDGFPPNGAWVYGSKPFGSSLTYSARYGASYRHHPRVHAYHHPRLYAYHGLGFRHFGRFPTYSSHFRFFAPLGWGGYGYSSPFAHFYRSRYYGSSLSFRTYIPLYAPVVTFPACSTTILSTPVVSHSCNSFCDTCIGASLQVSSAASGGPALNQHQTYSVSKPIVSDEYFSELENAGLENEETSISGYLASTQIDSSGIVASKTLATAEGQVPEELLRVADAILKVGGSSEAAQASARLAVRFGSSDVIYGRRFIAQIMAGDIEQAVVVVESARLAEYEIQRSDLPRGGLAALGIEKAEADAVANRLAKAAYEQIEDTARLRVVAYWLTLSGDDSRATLFFEHAERLDDQRQNGPTGNKASPKLISKR